MLYTWFFIMHSQEPGQLAQAITSLYHKYFIRKKLFLVFYQTNNYYYQVFIELHVHNILTL